MNAGETCKTCRYCLLKECHRHAPAGATWIGFPRVSETDWCGEYSASEDKRDDLGLQRTASQNADKKIFVEIRSPVQFLCIMALDSVAEQEPLHAMLHRLADAVKVFESPGMEILGDVTMETINR